MNYNNQATPSTAGTESPDTDQLKQVQSTNLAEDIDKEKLAKIGGDAKAGFDADNNSREEWLNDTQEWLQIAKQAREQKSWPWPDASNVKFPLISTAAMQFSARAYPSLVPGDGNIVKTRIIGKDPTGEKTKKGERIGKFMSWQLSYDMPRWEEDMDRLLIMLPVCGMIFKKTYFSRQYDKIVSELVYPENFVVDYWTNDLESSERYSEIVLMPERVLKEKQRYGEFLEEDLGSAPLPTDLAPERVGSIASPDQSLVPYQIIHQACWLDLDDDGIKEPYTVTFHYNTAKVLAIYARYTAKDVSLDEDGDLKGIKGDCYYTKFGFIPNPDGSFYDLGFGHLLGPINEAVNTLLNQLVDAGTLNNLQAGFVGKGLRLKMGDTPLRPGEWRAVNAVGDDLRKQMVPLPSKEPSKVLFELLGMLVSSGKELASVAEIFTGKMPGQNTPATTTMATIEQGMKVFTAIYKRIYRALDKEFKKVFKLNSVYLDYNSYAAVLDEPVQPTDFNGEDYDICPAADPTASSQQEQLLKAQALMELLPTGLVDPVKAVMRLLQAQGQPNWEELIPGLVETGQPQPRPQPNPKMIEMQQKMQMDQKLGEQKMQNEAQKHAMDQRSKEFEMVMDAQMKNMELQHKAKTTQLEIGKAQQMQEIFMRDAGNKMVANDAQHQQTMVQQKQQGDLKLEQQKQQAQVKKSNSQSGKPTQSPKSSSKTSGKGSKR